MALRVSANALNLCGPGRGVVCEPDCWVFRWQRASTLNHLRARTPDARVAEISFDQANAGSVISAAHNRSISTLPNRQGEQDGCFQRISRRNSRGHDLAFLVGLPVIVSHNAPIWFV